ncbi:protocadherin Fat 4-like [Paramuricea clavata]|uniref:Protocadherin Fat 4-like n=1 Tax=Paramuricea clavata TaxID=317549 RepID=A0A6S7JAK7_PARCT|nr:protocadherin Fat 4-like [Paramuricea clavata]
MAEFKIVFVFILLPSLQHITGQTANQLPYYEGLPNSFNVQEDAEIGSIVSEITAIDPEGEEVTMSLHGIGKDIMDIVNEFGVVNMTGLSPLTRRLSLKRKLDREARSSYSFQLSVKDYFTSSGRESYTSNMYLFVFDVNDNSPIFIKTPYITSLKENTPSDRVYQVEAEDADTGMSKYVFYSFTDECKLADCELFQIDTLSGIVKLNSSLTLDYETRNRYNLDILAKDRGIPSLNSTTTLVVKVEDQSDQPPEFEKSFYRADVDENAVVDTKVVQTKAFDGDRGIDKPVEYVIVGGDDNHYFKIDKSTGTIYVNSIIDRDVRTDYFELTVQATEIPGNASGNTTVFITIRDLGVNGTSLPQVCYVFACVLHIMKMIMFSL